METGLKKSNPFHVLLTKYASIHLRKTFNNKCGHLNLPGYDLACANMCDVQCLTDWTVKNNNCLELNLANMRHTYIYIYIHIHMYVYRNITRHITVCTE